MSDSKTPYELRLQMLQMAKDMVNQNFELQREIAMKYWDATISAAKDAKLIPEVPKDLMPKVPTLEDVMKVAEQMNSFVSGAFKK